MRTDFGALEWLRTRSDVSAAMCPKEQHPGDDSCIQVHMEQKPKYVARIDNVYFLKHLGASLREAAGQIATEELPENIRLLLRRLERLETRRKLGKAD